MTDKNRKLNPEQRLAKIIGHPLRVAVLALMRERGRLSPKEAQKTLGEGLSQVSYHFKVLKDFGAINGVGTEPRRGAVEHYYAVSDEAPARVVGLSAGESDLLGKVFEFVGAKMKLSPEQRSELDGLAGKVTT